jgi:hypothetical protein
MMSEKLVVEFCEDEDRPVALVLVWHGGDNPASASLTLVAFLTELGGLIHGRSMSALELASRFILFQQVAFDSALGQPPLLDAVLVSHESGYGCQRCRLHAVAGRVRAAVVLDQYSTVEEIEDAKNIWEMSRIPCDFQSFAEQTSVLHRV